MGLLQANLVPELKSLISLSIRINDEIRIKDLPLIKQIVVLALHGSLTLIDLPSFTMLQLGRQPILKSGISQQPIKVHYDDDYNEYLFLTGLEAFEY